MFRMLAVIAVTLTLAAGAAAGGYRDAHAASLASALLTSDDLPSGWTVAGPLDADAGLAFMCPMSAAPVAPLDQMGEMLTDGAYGATVYQTVSRYPPGDAAQLLVAARSDNGPCEWTQPLDDGGSARMSELPPAALSLGDEGASRQLAMQGAGFTLDGQIVLVRCGDMVAQLTEFNVGQDSRLQDGAAMQQFARAAVRRLGMTGQECRQHPRIGDVRRPV